MANHSQTHLKKSVQVVVQTAFIGDVFLSILFLKRLREKFSEDIIIYVAKKGVADFLLKYHLIDELFVVRKGHSEDYKQIIQNLNQNYVVENIFCLHKSLRSSFFVQKIKAKHKYGFKNFINQFVMSKTVEYKKSWPDPLRQLDLLTLVDSTLASELRKQDWAFLNRKTTETQLNEIPEQWLMPSLASKKNNLESKLQSLNICLNSVQKKVVLFPGSVWATKKWPVESYAQLSKELTQQGSQVFIMGGPDEVSDAQIVKKINPQAQLLAGELSLIESIEFLDQVDLVVCNDSSPTHFAAVMNKPTITIFGPTTLSLGFRPWNNRAQVVENMNLSCRPCGAHGPQVCPLKHHKCMKDISVAQVFEAVKRALI